MGSAGTSVDAEPPLGGRVSPAVLDLRLPARLHRVQLPRRPHLAAAARATWLGRMVNEHGSARVFDALAEQLREADFDENDAKACRSFAAEERYHGVLCGAVVESLGGEARAEIQAPLPIPRHEDVGRLEAVLRNVLSVSCLSETVAVALIGAERGEMPEGNLRDLLTRIWSDEVGHARFGWQIVNTRVPALPFEMRERLGAYLAVAFAHTEEHELAHLPLRAQPEDGEVLGLCGGRDARELFYETVETVIVPGLEPAGLPAAHAWANRHPPELPRSSRQGFAQAHLSLM